MKKYIIGVALAFFACSENKSKHKDPQSITIDLKNSKTVIEKEFFDLFKIDTVIELEFKDDFYLADIYRLKVSGEDIYALDPLLGNLIRYSKGGVPLNKIGLPGEGPEEMQEIVDFSIDIERNELLLGSYSARKISRFKPSGEFVSSIKLKEQLEHFSFNYDYFLVSMSYYNSLFRNLSLLKSNGDTVRTFFPFRKDLRAISLKMVAGHSTKGYEKGFLFNEPASSSIYSIKPEGDFFVKYKFISEGDMWPEKDKSLIQEFFQKISTGELNYLTRFYEESERFLFFSINIEKSAGRPFVIDPRLGYYDIKNKLTFYSKSFDGSLWIKGPLETEDVDKFYVSVSKAKINEFSDSHYFWKYLLEKYPNLKINGSDDSDTPILIRLGIINEH